MIADKPKPDSAFQRGEIKPAMVQKWLFAFLIVLLTINGILIRVVSSQPASGDCTVNFVKHEVSE